MDRGELLRIAETISAPDVKVLNLDDFVSDTAYVEAFTDREVPQMEVELMGNILAAAAESRQWATIERIATSPMHSRATRLCTIQLSDIFQRDGFQTFEEHKVPAGKDGEVSTHRLTVFWGPDAKEKWLREEKPKPA